MMKKIAIPTREGMVDDHFGHCAYYTVVTLDEQNQIVNQERLDSPEGCGCKSNIASVMQEMGITLMLAGNMGRVPITSCLPTVSPSSEAVMVNWMMCSGLIKMANYRILWNRATIMTVLTIKRNLCM